MRHLQSGSKGLEKIQPVNMVASVAAVHGCGSFHPAVEIDVCGGKPSFGVSLAATVLRAVGDNPLVNVLADVLPILHGEPLQCRFILAGRLLLLPGGFQRDACSRRCCASASHCAIFSSFAA